ncbi:CopY/TcrY family copper transport repressor [Streptococcus chenjunshii]|uniref:CopY/TcrY family copper transport repressor n=1 Tax=Streptococcus chenjunshii TaxID=2173853 RepID=A0A372KN77_9STRE|nr:CopY/TcrY family copper transport repressor [Streptococcus chenjunshii]AXQ79303.1 CopY/TcrY family copper transport repressor [Streptococcus chenjunshii]RFU50882.1 CopY/TcrY family copper transport repressor [Streptococcus chenjunshii]RFU53028.1 CopY/TcrY family copper transport repressor [Streptococcus chenjunshii]
MIIANAEWEVMRVVWTKGQTTSGEILETLRQKTQWSSSTVKTLLKRLVGKGCLQAEKQGKQFIYSALISEESSMSEQAAILLDKFCQRRYPALIEHLLDASPMTLDDIERLQALLARKRAEAVAEIPCHCIQGQCRCKENTEVF